MRGSLALFLAAAWLAASAASAQDRGPDARADLLALAETLGESHALAQACAPEDQTWRARMRRLIEVEAPDTDFEAGLAERFNAGFKARREQFSACTPKVAKERAAVAARGRLLSERLARSR